MGSSGILYLVRGDSLRGHMKVVFPSICLRFLNEALTPPPPSKMERFFHVLSLFRYVKPLTFTIAKPPPKTLPPKMERLLQLSVCAIRTHKFEEYWSSEPAPALRSEIVPELPPLTTKKTESCKAVKCGHRSVGGQSCTS